MRSVCVCVCVCVCVYVCVCVCRGPEGNIHTDKALKRRFCHVLLLREIWLFVSVLF